MMMMSVSGRGKVLNFINFYHFAFSNNCQEGKKRREKSLTFNSIRVARIQEKSFLHRDGKMRIVYGIKLRFFRFSLAST
jgi:hypothetical protein